MWHRLLPSVHPFCAPVSSRAHLQRMPPAELPSSGPFPTLTQQLQPTLRAPASEGQQMSNTCRHPEARAEVAEIE